MAAPATNDEFLDLVRKSGVVDEKRLDLYLPKAKSTFPPDPSKVAGILVRDGILTHFQAEQILQGKWRRFTIGKYKVLERLGAGGMGSVYLCEHKLMRRRVAVKVLPTAKAADPSSLERFYREARAVAALDHANIVHAYDIDQDDQLHFLVMEYVDGASLQDIIKKGGPMAVLRACHYMRQAALGLEHAHQAGLVHRDIKPGNILVDRAGVVKILDMGLARFFNDEDDVLTKKYDENVLGTADYLAPEQALDSHSVDIRADIYSLGATFYYMLTGRTPFGEGTVAQKLLWHQNRQPKLVAEFRQDVPTPVLAVISKMMAKEPEKRFQNPIEVANALAPFTQIPIGPPPESEMPSLSPAAGGAAPAEGGDTAVVKLEPATGPKALEAMKPAARPSPSPSPIPVRAASAVSALPAPPAPVQPRAAAAPPASPPRPLPTPAAARSAATPVAASAAAPSLSSPSANRTPAPSSTSRSAAAPLPSPTQSTSALDFSVGPPRKSTQVPQSEDGESPFADFAPETENLAAQGDTTPQSSGRRRQPSIAPIVTKKSRWVVKTAIVTFVALSAIGTIGWIVFLFPRSPASPVVASRLPLDVTRDDSKPKTFRSIEHALRFAKPGDVIQLLDETHHENLTIANAKDIVIQAAPGKEVVWTAFGKKDVAIPLIFVNGGSNVRVLGKGITLDGSLEGGKKLNNLIQIAMESPGLAIEDLKLTHFANAGVLITNAAGQEGKPIRIVRVETVLAKDEQPAAAIFFDANKDVRPAVNDYIEAAECKFAGFKTPIKTKDPKVLGKNVVGME